MSTVKNSSPRLATTLVLLAWAWAGCGYGSVTAALSGGNSGSGNAPSAATNLAVTQAKVSPATIRFALADAEGDIATVEWFYVAPDDPTGEEVRLDSLSANPMTLPTSAAGLATSLSWEFASEAKLDPSYRAGVRLIARVENGPTVEVTANLGNDAPIVQPVDPGPQAQGKEVRGIAALQLNVFDPNDRVDVKVEYIDGPTGQWKLARRAQSTATEELGLQGVGTPGTVTVVDFFWDTDIDLKDLQRDVRVRYTPVEEDGVATGATVETGVFTVDNNDAPVVQIGGGSFISNPDGSRGIPIPYTVIDEEDDPVRVLFQWRRASQSTFPVLGTNNPDQLAVLIEDPQFVRQKQICTPFPSYARGHAFAVDATRVRLPELRQDESRVLAKGVETLDLQLLRTNTQPAPLAATWSSNPLRAPAAALPLGEGVTALVLDAAGNDAELLEVDLATGTHVRTVVAGLAGMPSVMAFEPGAQSVLVATDFAGSWDLFRVDLDTAVVTSLVSGGVGRPTGPVGPLRSIVSLGPQTAMATGDDGIWQLSWESTSAPSRQIVGGLQTPWGLVTDPRNPSRVLVAERDFPTASGTGRIVSLDVTTRTLVPLRPMPVTAGAPAFPNPTAITIDGNARLLAICRPTAAPGRELYGLNLGRAADNQVYSFGALPADAATVAAGSANLQLVALPVAVDLMAGGGVEQARELESFDTSTATATVPRGFDPPVRDLQPWRIALGRPFRDPVRGSLSGEAGVFVWNSGDLRLQERVFIQALSFDNEPGAAAQTNIPRQAGEFVDTLSLSTGRGPQFVVAADLDGDGDLDLVTANSSSNDLTVFFQDAPRTFAPQPPLAAGRGPESVVAADLDGDGDLDLVSANRESRDLTVYFQDAPRTFTAQPPLAGGGRSLAAGDLDGDGDLDLVSGIIGGLTVFYQDAPRTFTAQPPFGNPFPQTVGTADLDGDGDLDLVSAHNQGLTVFYQDAPRTFTEQPPLPAGVAPRSVAVADLDGDGDLDLVSADQFGDELTVFYQDAPRTFTAQPPLAASQGPRSVVALDLDEDGDLDLASANEFGDELTVFLQDAPRTFTARPALATSRPGSVAAADLDGDGSLDLVSASSFTNDLTVFFQSVPRPFTVQPPLAVGSRPGRVTSADLDGDGDLDLVFPDSNNALIVSFQDAPRTFTAQPPVAAGGRPHSVVAADLDGDGDLDLVSANLSSQNLTVFFQDAPRVFTAQPPLAAGSGPRSVAVGDLDGDGDLDLVAANQQSDDLTVFFQDAPRVFTAQPPLAAGDNPVSIAAADLDGDGDLDLVCANAGSDDLTVFFQDAPRRFTAQAPLAAGDGPVSIAAADLDGDGDLDLVTANTVGDDLTVFFQDAPRTFTAQAPLAAGTGPESVAAADLDGDGDLDLVCANQRSDDLTVFFQDAPRRFTAQLPLPAGSFATRVAAADLDGDGALDLVSASRDLTVFWGR